MIAEYLWCVYLFLLNINIFCIIYFLCVFLFLFVSCLLLEPIRVKLYAYGKAHILHVSTYIYHFAASTFFLIHVLICDVLNECEVMK